MELRDIEIFLTLSEELHFGRTAERLHVSAARISQAIKKQERSIGAKLFERTSRRVQLTPVGEQLRGDLRPVFQNLKTSVDRARLTAQGKTDVLKIGLMVTNGHELRHFWDAFRSQHPQWGLRLSHNGYMDPFARLRNGEIDLLLSWLPVEEPDLTVGPVLFMEPRVALVSTDHRLAGCSSVTVEAFADHGVVGPDGPQPDYFEDAFVPFSAPSNRAIERKFRVTTLDQMYTLVADGEVIHLLGNQVTRYYARPDVTYVPVRGLPLLEWGLVRRSDDDSPMVRAFERMARGLGTMSL
ncbi:LysR family transcriptional regulator [Streptomyces tsukubensis]|uniref:LysR family transcriptional regulator n=1 Tax=Streptomyces tsukubensis TaxID=83656 RepID=UPI00367C1D34